MECAIELETSPSLSMWSWYAGAIQQYHYALLILIEIYAFPMRKEADRIWACLDYIFDVPRNLPREHKGRWIITQVRDKTGYYMGVRKARAPAKIDSFSQQAQRSASSSVSPVNNISQQFGGNAQPPQSDRMATGLSRQVSYGQPANAPYTPRHNPSAPSQVPLAPAGHPNMPPVSNAPMVDIDWVSSQRVLLLSF